MDEQKLVTNSLQFCIFVVGFIRVQLQSILMIFLEQKLELHSVVMKALINKYLSGQIIYNHNTTYSFCSFREFLHDQCPDNVYDQIDQSIFYAQLYFVREVFNYNLLTPEQQFFIKMTADLSFYSGSAYLAAQTNGLIQITDFHNSDQTSIKTESPSVLYNYTLSQYYDCLGTQFIEPYDPRCRFWYQYAKNNEGIFIYEPYNDSLSGTLQMNLAQKILKDSKFYSVISIIFIMQNLMQLYGAQISRNSYSVLFHEFDISVFYHPLHIFNVPMTWVDVEFFNIKQFCNDSQETMTFCLSQKQLLLNQINQTIAFIKTGEYSIENKVNLDQLFQRWERFGQKEISVIFPIQSKLKGYNNQKPYSFAILLIAKVITDQTDQLKLFNLLDAKVFRVYLIVGFIILSIIILLFIINYGVFLVYQIQKPIKLLILFLKKSYQEQLTHQKLSKINKTESKIEQNKQKKIQQNKKSSIFQKINNKKTLNQKPLLNNNNNNNNLIFTYKNINYIQDQFYKQDNPPLLLQNQPSFNFQTKELSFQQFKGFDKCDDTQKSDIQFTKNNSQSPKIPTSFEITCLNIKQQQSNQVQSISFGQNHLNKENLQVISTPKITTEKSTFSIQNDEFIKLKEENKNQILQGLTPLFLEMKIIKQTFQDLESLINYSIDAQNYNSEDFTKSLFHFSKAKSTFQQLKNQIGLCRCYYNLGLASLLNNNYQLGQEYFESAIQLSFETIGINYQDLTNFKIFNKSQNNYVKQLQILTKKIFSKAYCLKQQALSFYYNDQNENFVSFSLLNRNFFKHNHDIQRIQQRNSSNVIVQLINQSLNTFGIVLRFVENNQSSFSDICKIHLYQEMIEIYIFLRQNNNKIFYKLIEKVNQIMNNQKYQDNIMSEPSYISYVNTYKQIIEIQKSRQLFLLGLIEQSKNNNIEAFELFTQSIEEGSHYSPNLRKKLKYHLRQIINDINDIPFKNMVFEAQKSELYN
ncbi:tetratricopeptide repeat protein (macronuclear) [Tetrahymena thermophila SB210]|uniref:Tetratricopeptide repeat protein n=1 Tax=Tetrahymena thermophila (strain SB210) TaxID=312017 RepID=W7X6C1_TETTS|nr:tetratricopeptide repeat protein [Tetrahymena thermophila SB210]EWS71903.1 tetratricopeptide repeat protein [Tetrahymena thermophila SB210]|eukprot:XP_012655560.1 tetratricopeptide repeat protein [Tetrahymena thermophila SB210]